MLLFGMRLGELLVRLVLAVLVFFLVMWLLPALLFRLHIAPPDPIVFCIAILCALAVFFSDYITSFRGPRTPV